ncbi:hypothetical protein D9613_004008 [Agrocybe pediades]|uniref:ABC1 atypical kinase-like domain-containing protein n=1 Tax=Agrocybe pediades TaxID=84607 RepID=A0A8H4QK10_9AGAR|nr:hypothetical protein D9613_004008 [Agrocybe pediades]
MPPGPVYNWACVLASTADILANAARYRAGQLGAGAAVVTRTRDVGNPLKRRRVYEEEGAGPTTTATITPDSIPAIANANATYTSPPLPPPEDLLPVPEDQLLRKAVEVSEPSPPPAPIEIKVAEKTVVQAQEPPPTEILPKQGAQQTTKVPILPAEAEPVIDNTPVAPTATTTASPIITTEPTTEPFPPQPVEVAQPASITPYSAPTQRNLQSSKVPTSRIGRLFHYGGLAASLSFGAASEVIRRTTSGSNANGSSTPVMLTEANVKRLVAKLSQMRGAALKLGQFMSIQDTHVLPPEIDAIFRRVQDSAHYMPDWQMEQVLARSLSPDALPSPTNASPIFTTFDRIPFAAASIGQVHLATLRSDLAASYYSSSSSNQNQNQSPNPDLQVAVKIQFPGVLSSLSTDLSYLRLLLTSGLGSVLPKGMFLDKTLDVMKEELKDECDYTREAGFLRDFRKPEWLGGDGRFKVPWVWEGSTRDVLVMERVGGVSVGEITAAGAKEELSQQDRDDIASWILELCLKELFHFRTMQTDPNWTNFLWNKHTRQIELVDFGATRTYTKEFMDGWFALLKAAAEGDREACKEWSLKVGYLTGEEDEIMLDAHITSLSLLATPFKPSTPQPFIFSSDPSTSQWASITQQIRALIPVMLARRKTPPPRETYSLNRKLSGCFLLAARLNARVDTRKVWEKVVGGYQIG